MAPNVGYSPWDIVHEGQKEARIETAHERLHTPRCLVPKTQSIGSISGRA